MRVIKTKAVRKQTIEHHGTTDSDDQQDSSPKKGSSARGNGKNRVPHSSSKSKVEEVVTMHPHKKPKNSMKLNSSAPPKVQSFFNALKFAQGSKLLICLKGYPDPDNIATSIALRWLAKGFQIECDIIYFEEISHHENRALVKKLDIELIPYSNDFDVTNYQFFAVNDSQTSDLPIELNNECQLLVFVDHHNILGEVAAIHVDIRENA
ncbi:MAG: hypothetical protein OXC40_03270, partial [Proteobacteria bacterium]|nr:hypothetical protein [Pseudomonadota bacterium]